MSLTPIHLPDTIVVCGIHKCMSSITNGTIFHHNSHIIVSYAVVLDPFQGIPYLKLKIIHPVTSMHSSIMSVCVAVSLVAIMQI